MVVRHHLVEVRRRVRPRTADVGHVARHRRIRLPGTSAGGPNSRVFTPLDVVLIVMVAITCPVALARAPALTHGQTSGSEPRYEKSGGPVGPVAGGAKLVGAKDGDVAEDAADANWPSESSRSGGIDEAGDPDATVPSATELPDPLVLPPPYPASPATNTADATAMSTARTPARTMCASRSVPATTL
jgi:hypothetical protein